MGMVHRTQGDQCGAEEKIKIPLLTGILSRKLSNLSFNCKRITPGHMQHFSENACIMPLVMKACALSTDACATSALRTLNNGLKIHVERSRHIICVEQAPCCH